MHVPSLNLRRYITDCTCIIQISQGDIFKSGPPVDAIVSTVIRLLFGDFMFFISARISFAIPGRIHHIIWHS